MNAPKRIYLELNNVPPCNFGALWYEDPIPSGVAYRLESDVNEEIATLTNIIRELAGRRSVTVIFRDDGVEVSGWGVASSNNKEMKVQS